MNMLHTFLKYQLPGAVKSEVITKAIMTYLGSDKVFVIGSGSPDGIITEPLKENILNHFQQETKKIYFFSLFTNKEIFQAHCDEIAWGSYAWIATEPEHTIHYDNNLALNAICS